MTLRGTALLWLPAALLAAAAPPPPPPPPEETLIQESWVGGDEKKHYFLIGPRAGDAAPAEGYGLVVILPGGDGSADFHPFCRRIVEHALPAGFVGVQLVAPVWSKDAERVVWPTRRLDPDDARFTTEAFIAEVVREVKSRLAVDERYVFTLAWSSGGPAAYAASLQPERAVTGSFVAMSVFKPKTLPPLDAARGHPFYILHSPDDWISFDDHAAAARRALTAHGAAVELATYPGGHGWRDDPYARIRTGITWLKTKNQEPKTKN